MTKSKVELAVTLAKPSLTKSGKGKSKRRTKKAPKKIRRLFDAPAMAYAKLLMDPCNAPLTHPVGSPTGGILFRAQTILPLGATTLTNSAVLHWVPGALGTGSTELIYSATASGFAPTAPAVIAGAPAKAFLFANASDVRVVAACIKIMYDGAEGGRSGRIAYGNTMGGFYTTASVASTDAICAQLPTMERTPQATAEIRWKPTQFDEAFTDPQLFTSSSDRDRRGAITVAVVGHPVGSPLTLELTAVYEYLPQAGLGIVSGTIASPPSDFTVSSVVNTLSQAYENPWVKKGVDSFLANLGTMGTQHVRRAAMGSLAMG